MAKLARVIDGARSRLKFRFRSELIPAQSRDLNEEARRRGADDNVDARYRLTRVRNACIFAAGLLPPSWREWIAEHFFRRPEAPGPAAEHVVQYRLGLARHRQKPGSPPESVVAKGADNFYERQYRQYLNPAMGAFAMTASHVLLAAGGAPRGLLWWRKRKVFAAMQGEIAGLSPIFVLSHQTLAVPILLPLPSRQAGRDATKDWLAGRGVMPLFYRDLVDGEEVNCAEPKVRARERGRDGALLEVLDCVIQSGRLALLALHPHDPDAMGLHVTMFAAQIFEPGQLESDFGLASVALEVYRKAASDAGRLLVFCVGATEETFTQCSQNLFIKRSIAVEARRAKPIWPDAWSPALTLERLLAAQFETFQVSVSASGLPGASPRNGDRGKAAFIGRRGRKAFVLIPYHPGNAVHGHGAKLWSNEHGALVIFDDHSSLSSVTISGKARVVPHQKIERDFPDIAREAVAGRRRCNTPTSNPEYWHQQQITELVQQSEPLAPNSLDPQRPTCSISAGGQARHDKKPAYFDANSLQPYDRNLQHAREAEGLPRDPSGAEHQHWNDDIRNSLNLRRAHLRSILSRGPSEGATS